MSKKLIGLLGVASIAVPFIALAQTGLPPTYSASDAIAILPRIVSYVWGFFLAVVVLCIIIAGYLFVTGGGSPETVTKARTWLMYALVGLAIGVAARGIIALVYMVLGKGSPGTIFW